GARGVGQDVVVGRVVLVVVDAHDDGQVLALGRGGDDDLLGAGLEVLLGVLGLGEEAGGLDDDVHAEVAPGQLGRVALGERLHGDAADRDGVLVDLDLAGQGAQHRVVLEQVGQGRLVGEVVDGHDLDVAARGGLDRPPEVAADSSESVHAYTDGHGNHSPHVSSASSTLVPTQHAPDHGKQCALWAGASLSSALPVTGGGSATAREP